MKYFFLFCLLFNYISTFCQDNGTTTPCTDLMIQTTKGKWINIYDLAGNVTPTQKQEAYKRLDIIHNILLKMYPDPTGVDIRITRSSGIAYFGSTGKYRFTEDGRLTFDFLKQLPIKKYYYNANFSPHYCSRSSTESIFKEGVSNENSDGIGVTINDFAGVAGDAASDDDWLINGLPIRMVTTRINEKWREYEVYGDVRLRKRAILIHRKGMLPYTPVTRKQYLDRCIVYTEKVQNKAIESLKQIPVRSPEEQEAEKKAKLAKYEKDFGNDPKRLKSAVDYYLSIYKTDQQVQEESIAVAKKQFEQAIKRFTDELEISANQGLLDSPAFIRVMYISDMIFDTDPKTGHMLVTDNPDYIRKDLPVYVPQFIVINWRWSTYPPHVEYEKKFFQDFPLEKLQAMIDK